jgi:hypothetical protein
MSTSSFWAVLLLSFWLVSSSICVVTTRRCPANCRVNGMQRNALNRFDQECSTTDTFVKCSTSLWLTADGTLNVAFDGDSSAEAINESLNSQVPGQFFYYHTQLTFYANVSEILAYVRYSCFDIDDCSREFAHKMGNQLLSYQYAELNRRVRPLIYDPEAESEIEFSTANLACVIDNNGTVAPCNTSCYYLSGFSQEQHKCWPSTLVGLHVYTQNALPVPVNATISIDYSCNTRTPICNGPHVWLNVTTIVNDFFRSSSYISSSARYNKSQFGLVMLILCIFHIVYEP